MQEKNIKDMPEMGVKVDQNKYKIRRKFGPLTEVNWISTETGVVVGLMYRNDANMDGDMIELNIRWIVWHLNHCDVVETWIMEQNCMTNLIFV